MPVEHFSTSRNEFHPHRGLTSDTRHCTLYVAIESFKHRGLKRFFEEDDSRGIRQDLAGRISNILTVLQRARTAEDVNLPGLRLHPLKGELKGYWSVTVKTNWRIIFRFEGGNVRDVEFIYYH